MSRFGQTTIKSVESILSVWAKAVKQLEQAIVQRVEKITEHDDEIAWNEEQKLVHSAEIQKAKAALEKLKSLF